jgi:hypothetical protein
MLDPHPTIERLVYRLCCGGVRSWGQNVLAEHAAIK